MSSTVLSFADNDRYLQYSRLFAELYKVLTRISFSQNYSLPLCPTQQLVRTVYLPSLFVFPTYSSSFAPNHQTYKSAHIDPFIHPYLPIPQHSRKRHDRVSSLVLWLLNKRVGLNLILLLIAPTSPHQPQSASPQFPEARPVPQFRVSTLGSSTENQYHGRVVWRSA